ncbi:hypothetical protein ACFWE5_03645 [Cellulosimicrobium funkei]|uniref:hypothetical protein n=1 Tax=Cellulosimicrobium funkei TaxID=264251 RepID=UPI0036570F81
MDVLPLFVETLEELRSKVRLTASPYEVVRTSGLLRLLLIDGTAIGDSATGGSCASGLLSMKPVFTWRRQYVYVERAWLPGLFFDPVVSDHAGSRRVAASDVGSATISGSSPDLLDEPIVRHGQQGGTDVTVRDFIKHFASEEGGVHKGSARKSSPLAIPDPEDPWAMHHWTLLALGRVVYRGFEPLLYEAMIQSVPSLRYLGFGRE